MNYKKNTGVILLGYGGPHSLEDVQPYLADILHGKPLSTELVKEVTERYEKIGGHSPLYSIMQKQACALKIHLQEQRLHCEVEIGMRHWTPRILEGMQKLVNKGVNNIIAIPIAPYYSSIGTKPYLELVKTACDTLNKKNTINDDINFTFIGDWHLSHDLIDAFASRIKEAVKNHEKELFVDNKSSPFILFTAHSLPMVQNNDNLNYAKIVKETAKAVAVSSGVLQWDLAFQSQGSSRNSNVEWLAPSVPEKMQELKGMGIKKILFTPIGFLCDNVEILYDIDILFNAFAAKMDMAFFRTESLNTHNLLIRALANIVKDAVIKETVYNG